MGIRALMARRAELAMADHSTGEPEESGRLWYGFINHERCERNIKAITWMPMLHCSSTV